MNFCHHQAYILNIRVKFGARDFCFETFTALKVSVFGVFLVHFFSHLDRKRRVAKYLSVFSSNAGKDGPEKLRICTLFTQWFFLPDVYALKYYPLRVYMYRQDFSEYMSFESKCPKKTTSPIAGQVCNFIKKETLAQVFFCEFCEISQNTFFTEHLWTTASLNTPLIIFLSLSDLKNVHILVQLYSHIIIRCSGLEVFFKSTCNFTKMRPQHKYKSFNVVQIIQLNTNHST